MSKAIKYTTAVFYLFLILLLATSMLRSYAGSLAANAVYLFGTFFILLFALSASRRLKTEREEEKGLVEISRDALTVDRSALGSVLPLFAPIIGVTFLTSFLTSLLLGAIGVQGSAVEQLPLFQMLLVHALIPTLAEEVIFRLIPMLLLMPYNRKLCIIISSLGFAFIHMDLFQIPYALVAGILFMSVDLLAESVLPSVILHLLNNTVSVIWILYCTDGASAAVFVSALTVLSVFGLAVVIFRRKHYLRLCRDKLRGGEPCKDFLPFASLIAVTLFISVTNLLF